MGIKKVLPGCLEQINVSHWTCNFHTLNGPMEITIPNLQASGIYHWLFKIQLTEQKKY